MNALLKIFIHSCTDGRVYEVETLRFSLILAAVHDSIDDKCSG